ncbi:MAG: YihY/virulence factor BrkB family protein [Beijerinckiaceae bacterium]
MQLWLRSLERVTVAALAGLAVGYYWAVTRDRPRSAWAGFRDPAMSPPNVAAPATHGRLAQHPVDIPAGGWWQIARRTMSEIGNDRVLAVSAGVAFYALLALFPAVTAFVSLYGLVADRATVFDHLVLLSDVVPSSALAIMRDQMTRIVEADSGGLGVTFAISLATAIWSANAGVKALFDALNVAYREQEKRSFVWLNLVSLATTAGMLAAALLAIGAVAVLPALLNFFYLGPVAEPLLRYGRWPVVFLALVVALALLYRIGPSRREAKWRWVSPGALFSAVAWVGFSALFSWYAENFGNFNATYGTLGAVMALLLWMWLTAAIILIGAEINAESERQIVRDTTIGPDKPMGMRGAMAADVKAPA